MNRFWVVSKICCDFRSLNDTLHHVFLSNHISVACRPLQRTETHWAGLFIFKTGQTRTSGISSGVNLIKTCSLRHSRSGLISKGVCTRQFVRASLIIGQLWAYPRGEHYIIKLFYLSLMLLTSKLECLPLARLWSGEWVMKKNSFKYFSWCQHFKTVFFVTLALDK